MRFLSAPFLLSVLLCSSNVWAERGSGSDEEEEEYREHIVEGHRLMVNNERDAALRAYRQALQVRRNDAMATYLIACVQRANNDLDDALGSFQDAARLAGDDDASLKVRALMNIAFVQEMRRDFAAAREAWRAYIEFAQSHRSVHSHVQNARQRLDAITSWEELDAAYGPVRERIQARERENASSNQRNR